MANSSFEWDPKKNAINLAKHGVDFDLATEVFEDPGCREIFSRTEDGEDRYLALGTVWSYEGRFLLVVVYTYRNKKQIVRIISARRATEKEAKLYGQPRS